MTKKEQKAFDDLKQELRLAKAFNHTAPVAPDVPIPGFQEPLAKGFLQGWAASDQPTVSVACSSSIYHGHGRNDRVDAQGARRLYSTKLLALKALRYEVEQECAKRLAYVDAQIEEETPLTGEETD